ncbi:MAG: DUF3017 domain-containing protein [Corynebacterium sp.]|nr:DUF3017 domain-containing protein [Corynebacterium sp.]
MNTNLSASAEGQDNPHDAGVAPSRLSRPAQWALMSLWLVVLAVAVVFILTSHWRRGIFVLGVCSMGLSVLRFLVDSQVMGVLAVRSRRFDAWFTLLTGAALVFLALSVDALGS